mmetsp:Transcript_28534/g.77235  ORF Transcript_28534/g.77235 Transcript_28534/m.77235 type:complete len:315 (-) Transcript_28534:175-1119(-)
MGGDDLGSDDEYLTAPLRGVEDYGNDSSVEYNDSENINGNDNDTDNQRQQHPQKQGKKRQRGSGSGGSNENEDESGVSKETTKASASGTKQSKKRRGPLETLGVKIRLESTESKAEILSKFAGADFCGSHIAKLSSANTYDVDSNVDSDNFMDRLMCLVSKKQLKNNNKKQNKKSKQKQQQQRQQQQQQRSPRAIVCCLSARRSVAVLKDLAPMKLRVAKLFPKQGTIGEQARQLETTDFALAVGTPHRIKELIDGGSLTLENTRLLGLDTFLNPKNQSVYTLHDTAPFLKSILKEHAEPICRDGTKDLKIGFV